MLQGFPENHGLTRANLFKWIFSFKIIYIIDIMENTIKTNPLTAIYFLKEFALTFFK